MNIPLLIHNVGFILSALATLGLSLVVFFTNRRSIANITGSLALVFLFMFIVSHLAGVNVSDPNLSKFFLMFNLSMFPIGAFNLHMVMALTNRTEGNRYALIIVYGAAFLLTAYFLLFPNLFLLPSVPKMYFPNYYNPGALNLVRLIFLYGVCVPYIIGMPFQKYLRTKNDLKTRNQFKYLFIGMTFAYAIGGIANFLVYDIQIDPLFAMLCGVFGCLTMLFGAVHYRLFDVKVIARGAFYYAAAIAGLGTLLTLFNLGSDILRENFPLIPFWMGPFLTSIVLIIITYFIWKKLRESDLLKYEFVTTATHKFRTPLTHIKWATDNLSQKDLDADSKEQLEYIRNAGNRLVELTDSLVNVSEDASSDFSYKRDKIEINELFEKVLGTSEGQLSLKKLRVNKTFEPAFVEGDGERLKFVIQTILENAIHYSKEGGEINISIHVDPKHKTATCLVKDFGIGIRKEDISHIFSKFYRGSDARKLDTEGMGIGLFISREIIMKHGGKIWVESEGAEKGMTVSFSLPVI